LRGYAVGINLLFRAWLGAKFAGGKLRILLANRGSNIVCGEVVLRELVGAQPDAHRIIFLTE
jgi:hypothetical protein